MRAIEQERRAVCQELGIDYDSVCFDGPAMAKLDRLIQLRAAMPKLEAENLRLIAEWSKSGRAIQ